MKRTITFPSPPPCWRRPLSPVPPPPQAGLTWPACRPASGRCREQAYWTTSPGAGSQSRRPSRWASPFGPGPTSPASRTRSRSRCCWPTTGPAMAARSSIPGARRANPGSGCRPAATGPGRLESLMTTHRLQAELYVDRPIDEVFAFFSRPENLGRITPPGLRFDLQSSEHGDARRPGGRLPSPAALWDPGGLAQQDRRL